MQLKWDVDGFFCSASPGDPLDPLKHLCKGRLGVLTLLKGFNRSQLGMKRKKHFSSLDLAFFVCVCVGVGDPSGQGQTQRCRREVGTKGTVTKPRWN